jgi:methyl-accepting chemotaxis protein
VGEYFQAAMDAEAEREQAQANAQEIFNNQTLPALARTQESMKALREQLTANKSVSQKSMRTQGASSQWLSISLSVVGLVVGLLLSFLIIRSILKPITRIINDLSAGSEQVTAASGQVSSASQSLAEGSAEQASSLEEISSSLEEMAAMTRQSADHADNARTLSGEARSSAENGNRSMQAMREAMEQIKEASVKTQKIVKSIDEIAFQTNLLALNAAVEAARAGEAGKGFAVVAEEVRNLAQRAGNAARDTADLIEESVQSAARGNEIAGKMAEDLAAIDHGTSKVTSLVAEIAAAAREQSQGIEQVNIAVGQMDKVTQSNASNAEETASAAEEMSSQADTLGDVVDDLVDLVGSAKTTGGGHVQNYTKAPAAQGLRAPSRGNAARMLHGDSGAARPKERRVMSGHAAGFGMDDMDSDFQEF